MFKITAWPLAMLFHSEKLPQKDNYTLLRKPKGMVTEGFTSSPNSGTGVLLHTL